jgi:glycosyltransferase involved in cell wall biosynthesis
LADQCSFIPFVDDIWPVWFGMDIAVVPSTEPESFGMVAIEAMAAGVPVIAANHGGVLDILLHEQTGLLFPPRDALALADAIERLASDEPLRRRLGAAGATRQREFFSVERQVECTAKVYEGMIR